jgi:hypothetical protein
VKGNVAFRANAAKAELESEAKPIVTTASTTNRRRTDISPAESAGERFSFRNLL